MTLKVAYTNLDPSIASARYRSIIPLEYMRRYGVEQSNDTNSILIAAKHWAKLETVRKWDKVVFDICDDHFHTKHRDYYMEMCNIADAITCNSSFMYSIIKQETGRDAVIIDDPYEGFEKKPRSKKGLLWFGHCSNLRPLRRLQKELDEEIRVVTNTYGEIPWSPKKVDDELERCGIVVIPTDERKGKSANRMIESIRAGRFVCAEPLPAHDEFRGMMWVGNIKEGIEWAYKHPDEVRKRISRAQTYVRHRFSPERIAKAWLSVLESI